MLTAIYHPILGAKALEDGEYLERLIDSGAWFRHPKDAERVRQTYEIELRQKISVAEEGSGSKASGGRNEDGASDDQRSSVVGKDSEQPDKRLERSNRKRLKKDVASREDSK
jgi:hypothetical protein